MEIVLPIGLKWLYVLLPLAIVHTYFLTFYSLSFFAGGSAQNPIKWKFWTNWGRASFLDTSGRQDKDAVGIADIRWNSPFAIYQIFLNFFGAFLGWISLIMIMFRNPPITSDVMQVFLLVLAVIGISGYLPNLLSKLTSLRG